MKVNTAIANILRRLADRLHRRKKLRPVTPLEFIETTALAREIHRRSFRSLICWVNDRGEKLDVHVLRGVPHEDVPEMLKMMHEAIFDE